MEAPEEPTPAERRASMTWAQRLKRVFGIDVETCPALWGLSEGACCSLASSDNDCYKRAFFGPCLHGLGGSLRLKGSATMSKVCQVTGKRPVSGNNVSHAHNKTRRRFLPNLHTRRFWVEAENRWVKLRVSRKGLRIIDKLGIDHVLTDLRKRGEIS